MQAIHGGKAQTERSDSHKIAVVLRGGMRPQTSVSPAPMRAPRALLRRQPHLRRTRAARFAHGHHTNSQSNVPEIGKTIASQANREGGAERCADPAVPQSRAVDWALSTYDAQLRAALELASPTAATHPAAPPRYLWPTVPGSGQLLRLVLRSASPAMDRGPPGQAVGS
jgi:hypothetical protein